MRGTLTRIFNTLLDKTVVLSYTQLGYALRRPLWKDADLDVDMTDQVCMVTGASSGMGRATAEGLARLGATVTMLARDEGKGGRVREDIMRRTGNENVSLEIADLSSLASVRELAERFSGRERRLDVLINNAGALVPERDVSVDGFELSFATNVLGPFLLTNLLIPPLKASTPSRIINVSSGGMYTQKLDVDDLQFDQKPFNGIIAYAQAKRAQVILTELWAEKLVGSRVSVNAMHPGWADTPGLQTSLPNFHRITRRSLRTPQQGADTIIWLAVAKPVSGVSGKFWFDRLERATHLLPGTRSSPRERQRLWDECMRLSGLANQNSPDSEDRIIKTTSHREINPAGGI
jgi:NAD(P)-dependent dehydrogenase (short-subunit alcohol dehydrogenase family)